MVLPHFVTHSDSLVTVHDSNTKIKSTYLFGMFAVIESVISLPVF